MDYNRRENVIKTKSFAFAVKVVNFCKLLARTDREYILSKQLLRSGTAIGALYREAEQAESKKDFIHKLSVSLKECNESIYWLELLKATNFISNENHASLNADAVELIKLLISIITTTKSKNY